MSAWRLICKNGLMGWGKELGIRVKHLTDEVVTRIKDMFNLNVTSAAAQVDMWKGWSQLPFGQNEFNNFIDAQIVRDPEQEGQETLPQEVGVLADRVNPALSVRQAGKIKEFYEPLMNRYNEQETKWGAFNVLTAIASHEITGRKGAHVFSAGYQRMQNVVNNFYLI